MPRMKKKINVRKLLKAKEELVLYLGPKTIRITEDGIYGLDVGETIEIINEPEVFDSIRGREYSISHTTVRVTKPNGNISTIRLS